MERLQQGVDKKLKGIVETIRVEQNEVIREDLEQVIIVQGAAGSGKSTVALHRISYLLYSYPNLNASDIVVIAPNKLFLDYISEVLPDLDAKGVKQITFQDLITTITGLQYTLHKDEKMEMFLEGKPGHLYTVVQNLLMESSKLKGSLTFMKALEDFIKEKTITFTNNLQDITLYEGKLKISREEQVFKLQSDGSPYNQRLENLKSYIEFKIDQFLNVSDDPIGQSAKAKVGKTSSKGYIQRIQESYEHEMYYGKEINQLAPNERGKRRAELEKEQKQILAQIKRETSSFLGTYFNDWATLSVRKAYQEILQEDWIQKLLPTNKYQTVLFMAQYTKGVLESGMVEKEDLAPLSYLKYLTDGFKELIKFRHIVVDEAQDLSPFEFKLLSMLSQNKSFTILGDLSQGITLIKV